MLFAFTLTSRGDMNVAFLGSEWRVWQLVQADTNGVGVSQTSAYTLPSGRVCQATTIWLIQWRPAVRVERVDDTTCASSRRPWRISDRRQLLSTRRRTADPMSTTISVACLSRSVIMQVIGDRV